MPNIFIDKRFLVSGKKSVLHLHNPFDLTDYILDQIYLFSVTCGQNGTNIQTALHPITGVQLNCIELGGPLLHDTSITGSTFDLSFSNISDFTIQSNTNFYLQTPNIATATNGDVLTLIDKTTGECEWNLSAAVVDNIYIADGDLTGNRILDGLSSYSLNFNGLFNLTLEVTNDFFLPCNSIGVRSDGQVLTLAAGGGVSGEAVWADIPVQSAVNGTTIVSNNVELGGTLLHHTDINGQGYQLGLLTTDLNFTGDFFTNQTADTLALRSAQNIELRGDLDFKLITPNVVTPAPGLAIGQLLTLNVIDGTCDWENPSSALTDNIYTANGTLTGSRNLAGGGNDFMLSGIDEWQVLTTNILDFTITTAATITTAIINLSASSALNLITPNVIATSANNEDVLTAVNAVTGECDFKPIKHVDTFLVADWTAGVYTVTAATHNRGLHPIVQVYGNNGGLWEFKVPTLTISLQRICVLANGDVELHTNTDFDGKVVIM